MYGLGLTMVLPLSSSEGFATTNHQTVGVLERFATGFRLQAFASLGMLRAVSRGGRIGQSKLI